MLMVYIYTAGMTTLFTVARAPSSERLFSEKSYFFGQSGPVPDLEGWWAFIDFDGKAINLKKKTKTKKQELRDRRFFRLKTQLCKRSAIIRVYASIVGIGQVRCDTRTMHAQGGGIIYSSST